MWTWFTRPKPPSWWEVFSERNKEARWHDKKLEELRFLVLDTETTGLRPEWDRILSIGLVPIQERKIAIKSCHSWLWRQNQAGGKDAEIHGILPGHTANLKSEEESLALFAEQAAGCVWVAHHAAFDREMLQRALQRHFPGMHWPNPILDTADLHRLLIRSTAIPNVSLDDLCHAYRVPIYGRHTAEGDAFMTALVFLKMLSKLKSKSLRAIS